MREFLHRRTLLGLLAVLILAGRFGLVALVVAGRLIVFGAKGIGTELGLDAFVGVACPRVPIDDQGRYDKPFLTPQELDMVLGIKPMDTYVFDTYTAKSK